ncbi:hypothetical protein FB451DRAFT_1260090 [Mycena latifolia]|nr:hypothetical protein FB451DRAFT_1260090 [Mycena latifolia]
MCGFELMRLLVNDMISQDPAKRLNITEVVECFAIIRNGVSSCKLWSRVFKAKYSPFAIH